MRDQNTAGCSTAGTRACCSSGAEPRTQPRCHPHARNPWTAAPASPTSSASSPQLRCGRGVAARSCSSASSRSASAASARLSSSTMLPAAASRSATWAQGESRGGTNQTAPQADAGISSPSISSPPAGNDKPACEQESPGQPATGRTCLYASISSCRAPSSASRSAAFCCCSSSASSLLRPTAVREGAPVQREKRSSGGCAQASGTTLLQIQQQAAGSNSRRGCSSGYNSS